MSLPAKVYAGRLLGRIAENHSIGEIWPWSPSPETLGGPHASNGSLTDRQEPATRIRLVLVSRAWTDVHWQDSSSAHIHIRTLAIWERISPVLPALGNRGTIPSRRDAVPSAVRSTGLLIVPSSACSYPARQDGHLATSTTRRHPPSPPALQNPWTAERAASMPPDYVLDYCTTVSMAPP